jgi:2-polyprenyl-3-methyl-5-hydroxy-6-metoxy-1,4-benzoquinol methylase
MPQFFITRAVVRAVQGLPGFPALSVLDLSCGEGEILGQLAALGCRGQGTHYREDDYIVKQREQLATLPIQAGVDLHKPLPFDASSFDVVLLIEVLEHLESHFNIFAEAGRVLRPGGFLMFTTPNIFRLHSRWQFFLTGKHKLIRRRFGWDLRPEDRYAYHISPVDFPLAQTLLHHAGLEIKGMRFTRLKWKSLLFLPLWPLIWLACRLTLDRPARHSVVCQAGEHALNRWLTHPALLCSEQLFVVAQRRS